MEDTEHEDKPIIPGAVRNFTAKLGGTFTIRNPTRRDERNWSQYVNIGDEWPQLVTNDKYTEAVLLALIEKISDCKDSIGRPITEVGHFIQDADNDLFYEVLAEALSAKSLSEDTKKNLGKQLGLSQATIIPSDGTAEIVLPADRPLNATALDPATRQDSNTSPN